MIGTGYETKIEKPVRFSKVIKNSSQPKYCLKRPPASRIPSQTNSHHPTASRFLSIWKFSRHCVHHSTQIIVIHFKLASNKSHSHNQFKHKFLIYNCDSHNNNWWKLERFGTPRTLDKFLHQKYRMLYLSVNKFKFGLPPAYDMFIQHLNYFHMVHHRLCVWVRWWCRRLTQPAGRSTQVLFVLASLNGSDSIVSFRIVD